jgi:hypothetical protein
MRFSKGGFSKGVLLEWLAVRITLLYCENGFDPGNGTAQLKNAPQDRVLQYGKALEDLADAVRGGYVTPADVRSYRASREGK